MLPHPFRRLVPVLALAALTTGCLQIETRIKLHENGSATITERVLFTRRLLDLSTKGGAAKDIQSLLGKKTVLARMKQMGKGIRLVSHQVRDAEKGARESVAVFTIPDIRDFKYVSPYLAKYNYPKHTVLACSLKPCYESTWYGRVAGQMIISFHPASGERPPRRPKDWKPPKPPSPRDHQVLRDLRPVFQDLLTDFKLKLTFESYAPIRFRQYYRFRGMRAATHEYDLIDFSDTDMDQYGYQFLGNEEIMLELLRLRMAGANVAGCVKGHAGNLTVPVYHPGGIPEFYFRPSRKFFDTYFQGKTLKFDKRRGGPRLANFKQIGYHPKPSTKK